MIRDAARTDARHAPGYVVRVRFPEPVTPAEWQTLSTLGPWCSIGATPQERDTAADDDQAPAYMDRCITALRETPLTLPELGQQLQAETIGQAVHLAAAVVLLTVRGLVDRDSHGRHVLADPEARTPQMREHPLDMLHNLVDQLFRDGAVVLSNTAADPQLIYTLGRSTGRAPELYTVHPGPGHAVRPIIDLLARAGVQPSLAPGLLEIPAGPATELAGQPEPPVTVKIVDVGLPEALPLNALRLLPGQSPAVYQVLWPDDRGRFPGQDGYDGPPQPVGTDHPGQPRTDAPSPMAQHMAVAVAILEDDAEQFDPVTLMTSALASIGLPAQVESVRHDEPPERIHVMLDEETARNLASFLVAGVSWDTSEWPRRNFSRYPAVLAWARAEVREVLAKLQGMIDAEKPGLFNMNLQWARDCIAAEFLGTDLNSKRIHGRFEHARAATSSPTPSKDADGTGPDTDPDLTEALRRLGDRFGPLGVALVAASLSDPDSVARRLTEPKQPARDQAAPDDRHLDDLAVPDRSGPAPQRDE